MKMTISAPVAAILCAAICSGLAAAPSAGSAPTVVTSLSLQYPSNPQVSPDGRQVVYQVWHTDWDANAFVSDLWAVLTAAPHKPVRLTEAQGSNSEAQWSPDGKQIAFLSNRSGRSQVWVMSTNGKGARRVTDAPSGVNLFRWSPDASAIAFTTDGEDRAEGGLEDKYGAFEIVKPRGARAGLWAVRLHGKDAAGSAEMAARIPEDEELISDTDYSVGSFEWSPDGKRMAFQADALRPDANSSYPRYGSIYTLDLKSFDVRLLTETRGPQRNPVWSPDSAWVAFETSASSDFFYSNWQIVRASASGGKAEVLSGAFDENADLIAWTPAGIFFGALQKTASHLFRLAPETHAIERVTTWDRANYSQFSVSADGQRWASIRGDKSAYPEVVAGAEQLTDFGADVRTVGFAAREVVRWKSPDGAEIEGVLLKPADFDPLKKYPLLVVLHGGPVAVDQPMIRPDRTYPLEQFVARGALVLRPNYRGSAGYGAALRALNVRNLGTGDAMDVIAGVDALIERGFIDRERIGAMGWSQGGFIAAYLGTATSRFRAVSVGAGISDWTTYYVNTDITSFTRQYMKATPWEDPEVYRKASPVTYINQAKTPTLIQHGDQDRRVPIPNAYELRQALEDHGVPVKMVVYKGFGHSIDRPKQQRAVMEHNLEWFEEWILSPKATPANLATSLASGGPEQSEIANTPPR